MNKKKAKTLRLPPTLAFALTLALVFGSFQTAFAAPPAGTKDDPAQAAITKTLQMPAGTATPAYTFNFTVTEGYREGTAESSPYIPDKSIAFTAADAGTDSSGVKTVKKQTTDILAGIAYPSTGIYNYTITESGNVTGYVAGNDVQISLSEASYDIKVYVADDNGTLYVKYVEAKRTKNDDDTSGGDAKVDPTPGDGVGTYSALEFTNKYVYIKVVNPPGNNTDPGTLYIDESVTGALADSNTPFTVAVTVTQPAVIINPVDIKAYLVDGNGTVASPGTAYTSGDYYTFITGTARDIIIKPGQRLVFDDLPVGTAYVATQAGVPNYIANVTVVYNGGQPFSTSNTADGQSVSTAAIADSNALKLVASGISGAKFVNDYDITAPTGIIIDNLPYILLVVLAVAALAAYVITRSRKRGGHADANRA